MSHKAKNFQFNWETLNFEHFRGPGLSFPVSAELVMVPEFDELVIAATDSFPECRLVPLDAISCRVLHTWERGKDAEAPFNELGPSDLGMRLHYLEGDHKDIVLKLKDTSKPKEERHYV